MPTANLLPLQVNAPTPGMFLPPSYRPDDVLIGPWSRNAIGPELCAMAANNWASAAYPAANRIIAYPFEIADSFLVVKVWSVMGTTTTGDGHYVGVYNEDGSTAVLGPGTGSAFANSVLEETPAATVALQRGRFWCAYYNSGTPTPISSATPIALLRAAGCAQMASVTGNLPATFVPAAIASAYMPLFGIAGRTQVA